MGLPNYCWKTGGIICELKTLLPRLQCETIDCKIVPIFLSVSLVFIFKKLSHCQTICLGVAEISKGCEI